MNTRTMLILIAILLIGTGSLGQALRPDDLVFKPLEFDPPDPADFRTTLAGVMPAYLMQDSTLPQFSLTALIHFGDLYVPAGQEGLGDLMSGSLISGGTTAREGEAIEDRLEFLGGSLTFSVGERIARLSLWVLSKDIDEGLDLFFDVLRRPEFREEPLGVVRARLIQQLHQANDQPAQVLSREYEKLIYGEHPLTARPTRDSYMGITPDDLKAVHARYFAPGNIILAAAGDFAPADLEARLVRRISGWPDRPVAFPTLSADFPRPDPGVYFIQKQINQGYVSLGHLGIEETNPDYHAVQVMNFILGGGSFTSRITSKVRSDEGLSYNQGSRFTYRWGLPGTFSGYVQTKSETVGYAISLIQNEFDRIRTTPVSDQEMATAVNYYLESFSNVFASPLNTMTTFAEMEMTNKPMDYYRQFRSNIEAVTKERVLEVADRYIQPERMAIMIVGDREPCDAGGEQWPGPLDRLGPVREITLTDPLTGR
jgi:zinc protease